jgi:4'-phosphopantetheinyl transferase
MNSSGGAGRASDGASADHDGGLPAGMRALSRPDPAVALWLCPLDRPWQSLDAMVRSLSPEEHTRAARFGTETLRQRWIIGRATLRYLLGSALGIKPGAVRLRRGVRGRPEIAAPSAPDFNVSHTGAVALIGIGVGLSAVERIGVDIERADRVVNADGLARKFLTEHERAELAPLDATGRRVRFLRLWTCKEAMSKATGDALSAPFRCIDVRVHDELRLVAGPAPYAPERWRLLPVTVPPEFIATVAIWRAP